MRFDGSFPRRFAISALVLATAAVLPAPIQAQALPAASGRTIEASDGDVIVIPSSGRVALIRRSIVTARLVYVERQQTVLLITDPPLGAMGPPGAKGLRRWEITDPWPFDPRWEGSATIDEHLPSSGGPVGLAIHTDRGMVFLGAWRDEQSPLGPRPVAAVGSRSGSSRPAWGSFDEIEQAWLAGGDSAFSGSAARTEFSMPAHGAGIGGVVSGAEARPLPPGAVRVGGSVRVPEKLHHVDPVHPAVARAAGVAGVVILEVTLGEDGSVSDARVLRSVPLLDVAAVDAVRQWRFAPTLVNGVPRPVVMTVTVNFASSPPP